MVLDLYDLAESATGGAPHSPISSKFVAAALMPVMILFGGGYRFWANEITATNPNKGPHLCQYVIGVAGWAVSCAIFALVVLSITDPGGVSQPGPAHADGALSLDGARQSGTKAARATRRLRAAQLKMRTSRTTHSLSRSSRLRGLGIHW
jgi:hypothetical protein